jgi:ABC-type methionine transport system permease subunit
MTYLLITAGVLYVLVRRFRGEPLNARDLLAPPAFLLFFGIRAVDEFHLLYLLPLAAGFAFGAFRGMTITLFERDGHLWQRYTPWTLLVWVTSIGVSFGFAVLLDHHAPTQLSIGVSMLGELCAVGAKALHTGLPFAPERVSNGRHGTS